MTREEKIYFRKQRAFNRKAKRIAKDREYISIMYRDDLNGIGQGRKRYQGKLYRCEMGYSSCELRGYCNGDC